MDTKKIVEIAWKNGFVIPAFNVPYLPMVKPVVQALRDESSFGLVQVSRLEWIKFKAGSLEAVRDEYKIYEDRSHTRLHLDHVPVIDEDGLHVDYMCDIREAVALGYESVMIDASRLDLEGNILASKEVGNVAHKAGIPFEAELGAVMGHEANTPSYEEIFEKKMGFTKIDEAARFAQESGCDWLSIAFGNIHGAISEIARKQKKPQARLSIEHLAAVKEAVGIPLVLHGGSGIPKEYILQAAKNGIAKINVGTEIRQQYEKGIEQGSVETARELVYKKTREIIKDLFEISGTADIIKEYK